MDGMALYEAPGDGKDAHVLDDAEADVTGREHARRDCDGAMEKYDDGGGPAASWEDLRWLPD